MTASDGHYSCSTCLEMNGCNDYTRRNFNVLKKTQKYLAVTGWRAAEACLLYATSKRACLLLAKRAKAYLGSFSPGGLVTQLADFGVKVTNQHLETMCRWGRSFSSFAILILRSYMISIYGTDGESSLDHGTWNIRTKQFFGVLYRCILNRTKSAGCFGIELTRLRGFLNHLSPSSFLTLRLSPHEIIEAQWLWEIQRCSTTNLNR